jgi:glycosyltransferase involved in cell wall biosynthesis
MTVRASSALAAVVELPRLAPPPGATLGGVSVVLPAFNEEANLAGTVRNLGTALRRLTPSFEIIIVDDGSVDRTRAVALGLAARVRGVRVVTHADNRGYGAALRSGFAASRLPWVFFTDADGQFEPNDLARVLALAPTADIVAGYRIRRRDPWYRRLAGVVFGRVLMRAAFGIRSRDLNCAFKLIRRDLLSAMALKADGALINAELLARAQRSGARLTEVGVTHRPRRAGVPTGGRPLVAWRALQELRSLRREILATPRASIRRN